MFQTADDPLMGSRLDVIVVNEDNVMIMIFTLSLSFKELFCPFISFALKMSRGRRGRCYSTFFFFF